MSMDPVSDLLTKIRNGSRAKHKTVEVPASSLNRRILQVLKQEGFITAFKPVGVAPKMSVRVYLKYMPDRTPAITELIRSSRPGRRHYRKTTNLPRVLSGLGRAVLTTSKGIMTDKDARKQHIGGEVLCYVW